MTVATPPQSARPAQAQDESVPVAAPPLIQAKSVSVFYGEFEAIRKVSLEIARNEVIALIGPSGCGKSTFLRSINRINDLIPGCRVAGELSIGGQNIYGPGIDLVTPPPAGGNGLPEAQSLPQVDL